MAKITNNLEYQKALDYENFLTTANEKILCLYFGDFISQEEYDEIRTKLEPLEQKIYDLRHDYDKKRLKELQN